MAVTTPISEFTTPINEVNYFGKTVRLFFGQPVPEGITDIALVRAYINHQKMVRWRTRHHISDEFHEMPFEQTDEGVTAALVAMKLTC